MLLEHLLGARAILYLLDLGTVLAGLSLLYGVAKILYQRFTGRVFPSNAFTLKLDAANELAVNVVGLVNRAFGGTLIVHPEIARRDAIIDQLTSALAGYQRGAMHAAEVSLSTVAQSDVPAPFDPTAHITRAAVAALPLAKDPTS